MCASLMQVRVRARMRVRVSVKSDGVVCVTDAGPRGGPEGHPGAQPGPSRRECGRRPGPIDRLARVGDIPRICRGLHSVMSRDSASEKHCWK